MCGIGGYLSNSESGSPDPRLGTVLPLLGVFMETRGDHSWGWTDGVNINKNVGKFRDGFFRPSELPLSSVVHTRFATFGARTQQNAHPFSIKGIIGVHNGMISNHKEVAAKYGIEYNVDSEIIFNAIADGIPMSELEGYGTIVFYLDGKLFLGRFSTRGDLHLAKTDVGWVWASEKQAVLNAVGMANVTVKFWVDTKLGQLYELDGDNIYKAKLDMKLKVPAPYVPKVYDFKSQGDGYGKDWYDRWYAKNPIDPRYQLPLPTSATTTFTAEPKSDYDEVVDLSPDPEYCAQCINTLVAGENYYRTFGKYAGMPICKSCYQVYEGQSSTPLDAADADSFTQTTAASFFRKGYGTCWDCGLAQMDEDIVFASEDADEDEVYCQECFEFGISALERESASNIVDDLYEEAGRHILGGTSPRDLDMGFAEYMN